jgi:UDP:flavonoid glycosyltransferase YjiC (YdhE family)
MLAAARIGLARALVLGTERSTPEQIRTAVRTILADGDHRGKALSSQASFAQYTALGQITKQFIRHWLPNRVMEGLYRVLMQGG